MKRITSLDDVYNLPSGKAAGEQEIPMSPDGPYPLLQKRPATKRREQIDPQLSWLTLEAPAMERWRDLAHRWLSRVAHDRMTLAATKGVDPSRLNINRVIVNKMGSLHSFLVSYLQDRRNPERIAFINDPTLLLCSSSNVADDFWEQCCMPIMLYYSDGIRTMQRGTGASARSWDIYAFLTWVIDTEYPSAKVSSAATGSKSYLCPFHPRTSAGVKALRIPRWSDLEFTWVAQDHPHLKLWGEFASRWIRQEKNAIAFKLTALIRFIGTYLANENFPNSKSALNPLVFLLKSSRVPEDLKFGDSLHDRKMSDTIVTFLDWILLHECSESDDYGHLVLSSEHRNPFQKTNRRGLPATGESVHSPLPYGYIDDLRRMLVQGPNFNDWAWAKEALGTHSCPTGWFPVNEKMIDKNDPDCVWRIRQIQGRNLEDYSEKFEIWSPVRWVALLVKLILPLRTYQVTVLDSGEADTRRYDGSNISQNQSSWIPNDTNKILRDSITLGFAAQRSGHQITSKPERMFKTPEYGHGVLRRIVEFITETTGSKLCENTVLHINTNKTADRQKEGSAKGFDIPWPILPWPKLSDLQSERESPARSNKSSIENYRDHSDLARNIHYWFQKLRDWQTKYNPVEKITEWDELISQRIILPMSEEQIETYSDAVFLFREPAFVGVHGDRPKSMAHLPIKTQPISNVWWLLLRDFQFSLAKMGKTAPDGSPIKLVYDTTGVSIKTPFPLHSLRVSLITALALDGGMSLPLLQKVVGHSRLLMTLYYTKPGADHVMREIDRAHVRLSALEEQGIQSFLASASIEQLREQAVFNDEESAFAALGKDSTTRNPAGWMPMHHGICPMGGNTDAVPENTTIGGCHNGGGKMVNATTRGMHGPVPGGARNCVRCRWFITEPRYVPALVVHCNNLSYQYHLAQTLAIKRSEELEQLKDRIYDAEKADAELAVPLYAQLIGTERRFESTLKNLEDAAQSMTACYSLVRRGIAVARARKENGADNGNGMALIANGGDAEWDVVVEGTDSELLQLSGVLEDAEVYPDMNPGEAVIRRSQLLDSAFNRDGIEARFFALSREEQHLLGNEVIRRIAHECDAEDSLRGKRMAIAMLENSSAGISDQLGKSKQYVTDLLQMPSQPRRVFSSSKSDKIELSSSQHSGDVS